MMYTPKTSLPFGFNSDIVECKECQAIGRRVYRSGFNSDIVECKDASLLLAFISVDVLIAT